MTIENLALWDKVEKVPPQFLKEIAGGPLKGKSDINPQWRMKELTEEFGPCGKGWWYEIINQWTYTDDCNVPDDKGCILHETVQFVEVRLFIDGWPGYSTGVGGSMLGVIDKNGFHLNDEALKMATTDAISVACKQLGFASAVYEGRWDGSKYKDPVQGKPETPKATPQNASTAKPKAEPKIKTTPKVTPKTMPKGDEIEYLTEDAQATIAQAFIPLGITQEMLEEKYGKPMAEWTEATQKLARIYHKSVKSAQAKG